jgi:hypothetical protein
MTQAEFRSFYGNCPVDFPTLSSANVGQAVSSSPDLMTAVQQSALSGVYTNSRATAPCQPFTVQSLAGTADVAAVAALYARFVQVYPTLFTNVNMLGGVGGNWTGSYCQEGIFPSNQTRFIFCVMYRGTFLFTVAVGYPPPNQAPAGSTADTNAAISLIRTIAARVGTAVN